MVVGAKGAPVSAFAVPVEGELPLVNAAVLVAISLGLPDAPVAGLALLLELASIGGAGGCGSLLPTTLPLLLACAAAALEFGAAGAIVLLLNSGEPALIVVGDIGVPSAWKGASRLMGGGRWQRCSREATTSTEGPSS